MMAANLANRRDISFAACLAAILLQAPLARAAAPPITLSNQNFTVTITASAIATNNLQTGARAFSAAAFEHAAFEILRSQAGLSPTDTTPFEVTHNLSVMSLTGPNLALRDDADIEQGSGAIQGGFTRYWTLDLRRGETYQFDANQPLAAAPLGGAITALTSLYTPEQIAARLAIDPFIRKLAQAAPGESPQAILAAASAHACFEIPADILTSFAIFNLHAGQMVVRLGLPGQPSCHAKFTVLGLVFPSGAALQPGLASAAAQTPPPGQPPSFISEGYLDRADTSQFSPAN
jgi:hypothetical protein